MPGVLVTALGAAVPAAAQSDAGGRRAAPQPTRLQMSMDSGFETIGSTGVLAGPPDTANAAIRLRSEISHDRTSRRASLRMWAGVTADQGLRGTFHGALSEAMRVDAGVQMSRRMRFDLSESVSWAPLDLFTVFGSVSPSASRPVIGSSSELDGGRTLTHDFRGGLTRTIGTRLSMSLTGGTGTSQTYGGGSYASRSLGARVTRQSGRFTSWHAGYRAVAADFVSRPAERGRSVRHDLDGGFTYARPLSFWRHTSASFDTGSTLLTTDEGLRFRLNLTAAVERQMTAHWSTRVDYSRPIEFVAGFVEPLLSDAVRLSLTGKIDRRLTVTVTGGYASGTAGVTTTASPFRSAAGSVVLARQIHPEWRVEAEWSAARYGFATASALPASIPERFTRQNTRVRLVWTPAVMR